jgi:hypothetical protein
MDSFAILADAIAHAIAFAVGQPLLWMWARLQFGPLCRVDFAALKA